ncbi:MAG: hypothetical protein JG777_680 [Clostridia bacterium]|nr:hypothetical protein [Clostridia bacterium]
MKKILFDWQAETVIQCLFLQLLRITNLVGTNTLAA